MAGLTPNSAQVTSSPPNNPDAIAAKVSMGVIASIAITRGATSASIGLMPITCMASIS
jgi:hypothetical protein